MNKKIIISIIATIIISFFTINKVFSKEKQKNINKQINIEDKFNFLGNINKKINYFKEDYLDRYISYKKRNKSLSNSDVVLHVNIGIDQNFYTNIKEAPKAGTNYVLVNKFYYLNKDYIPNNLEEIDNNYSVPGKKLVNTAKISFEFLAKKAKEEGLTIRAISTYRSYDYQSNLYNKYIKEDGVEKADKYSARPGFSEHQTGFAVDVDNKITNYNNFDTTKEYKWMLENAHKYGFILRYPKGKEHITGYMYEPWHYRYVGVNIATFIKQNNLTYEEYYFKYFDK
ncbi:MAG: M15 family metallopeptidase [Bacilli bacterium]|nr:M15 family metallopeptidase [Bacilli bacterium]